MVLPEAEGDDQTKALLLLPAALDNILRIFFNLLIASITISSVVCLHTNQHQHHPTIPPPPPSALHYILHVHKHTARLRNPSRDAKRPTRIPRSFPKQHVLPPRLEPTVSVSSASLWPPRSLRPRTISLQLTRPTPIPFASRQTPPLSHLHPLPLCTPLPPRRLGLRRGHARVGRRRRGRGMGVRRRGV